MLSKVLFAAATACGLFVSSVNGHMVIYSPVPYGQDSLTNSPLENDGSDFPCKQRSGVYDITKMNEMPVGVPQTLAFMGGATHGGGSCQVSVTLDKEPTQDSEWKVIHSIVGGCPSNASANLSQDPNGKNSAQFQFSVPKGMPNGEYTLAWTWFNKIGNREMYMNCAPISVTGGADNNDVYNSLPTMFVINLPREECATTEMEDFVFPDPGLYVETAEQTALGSSTIGSGCAAVTAKGAGKGSAGSPAQPTGYSGSGSASSNSSDSGYAAPSNGQGASAAPTAAPLYTFPGVAKGVDNGAVATETNLITVIASGSSSSPAAATEEAGSAAAPAPESYSAPSEASSSNATSGDDNSVSSGSCSGGAVSCPTPGSVVCIGSDKWGLCDINNCAVPMALSDGTSCAAGVVSKRNAGHMRRHLHHARSY